MADIEIDVSAKGLADLAAQGKLTQAALVALNKELSALEDRSINEDRAIRKVVDALQSINVATAAASGSSEKLTSTQIKLNAALNDAGTKFDNVISQTAALAAAFNLTSTNNDKAATSIKKQSSALQELIDKTKNFQILSSSTPNIITQKLSDGNVGARLDLQRRINAQGIISPDRIRVIQQLPLDTNAINRIRELNAGLTQQQLLNIRIAFAAKAGTDAIKGLTDAERALNIANKDVLSSEGQFAASLLGVSAAADRQTNRLRQLRGLQPLGSNFVGAPRTQAIQTPTNADEPGLLSQIGTAAQFVVLNQAALLFRQTLSFVKREILETAQAAAAFNRQILAIRSISQDSQLSVSKFGDAITNIANQFNLSQTDTAAAEYEILSQQIAKGADSFAVLAEAAKLAQVTQTSAATSAKAISAAINAYGLTAKDAERVSAVLFRTIDLGSVTLDELANSIGRTGTIARTLGISIEESAAALQALSVQGVRGEDANTQLLNLFNQLLSPSKELTKLFQEQGFATGEAAVETLHLSGVIALINEKSNGSAAALKELLGDIRAVRGGAGLANEGFAIFAKDLEQTANNSIPILRAAVDDFSNNSLEGLTARLNAVQKTSVNVGLGLLQMLAPEISPRIDRITASLELLNKAQLDSSGKIAGAGDRLLSLVAFVDDLFAITDDRVNDRARAKANQVAQVEALKDFNTQVLNEERKLALETNKIQQDKLAKIQAGNFKERDEKLKIDKQITDSLINATQIRVKEIDKILAKQQEEIDNSKKLIDQLEKQKKATLDAQQVQRDKENIQDIEHKQRTPQEIAAARAGGNFQDLTNAEINPELNRRGVLKERVNEINRARLEIEGALNQPDALANDSGAIERIRKLADRTKALAQENLDDERQKRFALDEAIFNKRQELQTAAEKGVDNPEQLFAFEQQLGALLRRRADEETRINDAAKEREAAFALELSVEERLAKLGKEKLGTQESVNEQLRKAKDAQDALTELAKLEIFNKEGKAAFSSPEDAQKKVSQLLGSISQHTQDPELLKIANRAADRANSQIETQRKIGDTSAQQKQIADINEQIKKAIDIDAIEVRVNAVGALFNSLGETIETFGGKLQALQDKLKVSVGVGTGTTSVGAGFAEGAVSISSRDSIPAWLSPGESVINSNSTSKFFNKLVSMNNGVDPSLPNGSTRFGDINVTVTGVNNPGQIADELPSAIKRVLRRGTWRNK